PSMPEGSSRVCKTGVRLWSRSAIESIALLESEGAGARLADFVKQYALCDPNDPQFVALLPAFLKKEQAAELFRSRLTDRPVNVNWHRGYQEFCETAEPSHDLEAEYRGYLAKDE